MVIALHSKFFYTDFITSPKVTTYLQYALRIISEGVVIFIFVNRVFTN